MHSPNSRFRRKRAPEFLAPYPPKVTLSAGWREGVAIGAGLLVLLVTAWLIWAALAEATLAVAQAA